MDFNNFAPMKPRKTPPNGKIGDYGQQHDKYNEYYSQFTQGRMLPPQRPVVLPPDQQAVPPSEADRIRAIAQVVKEVMTCGLYFVKSPNWVEPPITATCVDERNERPVVVGIPDTVIVTFTVPDRFVGTLVGFGHGLDDPAGFGGGVTWNIRVNGAPQRCYTDFEQQIGTFIDPTGFPMPIRIKYRDVVDVTARLGGFAAASAFARLTGWMWPAVNITNDGSYDENHTI